MNVIMNDQSIQPKILVGIVTYDGHRYALDRLLEAINKFTYPHFTVIFADNSATDEYKQLLESKGFEVLKDASDGTRIDRIIRGRNTLRAACLERGYDYLFFLDSDVIPPVNILEQLLRHKKDVLTGIYLGASKFGDKTEIQPVLYAPFSDKQVRTMLIKEVLDEKILPIAAAGLGCCLIHRHVLERIAFRNIAISTTGGEDAAFFKDVQSLGITPYGDTSMKCFHMSYPEGDKRNEFYTFENYIKKYQRGTNYSFDISFG